jgi:hypothetical protein
MASEREANRAREQHSDRLRELGAHAIAVDEIGRKGGETFAVIAYFEKKPAGVPAALEIRIGKRTLAVPLVARVMERFKPE